MKSIKKATFTAVIDIIGINPFVSLPEPVWEGVFRQAQKEKGPIPIRGTINGKPFRQTLVKFKGAWRLYVNNVMLKDSPRRVGEAVELFVEYDPEPRTIAPHPDFIRALNQHKKAKQVFEQLPPSLQKEIVRYIANLKTETSVQANIVKAIGFLTGKNKFIGREPIRS